MEIDPKRLKEIDNDGLFQYKSTYWIYINIFNLLINYFDLIIDSFVDLLINLYQCFNQKEIKNDLF